MAWYKRKRGGERGYFYFSYREGEKRIKRYVGNGPEADAIAAQVEERRKQRSAGVLEVQEEQLSLTPAEEASEAYTRTARLLTHALLLDAGYYRHKRQWRKRRIVMEDKDMLAVMDTARKTPKQAQSAQKKPKKVSKASPEPRYSPGKGQTTNPFGNGRARPRTKREESSLPPEKTSGAAIVPAVSRAESLQALVNKANAGDREALAELRCLLDTSPEIWQTMGDLERYAEIAWFELIAGGSLIVTESLKRQLRRLKEDLAGPAPDALEALLVGQVAITWLASRQAEADAASQGGTSHQQAVLRLKRAESAGKRHLMAVKTLAAVRALTATSRAVEVKSKMS